MEDMVSVLMWECCEWDEAMDITDWARLLLTGSGRYTETHITIRRPSFFSLSFALAAQGDRLKLGQLFLSEVSLRCPFDAKKSSPSDSPTAAMEPAHNVETLHKLHRGFGVSQFVDIYKLTVYISPSRRASSTSAFGVR